MIQSMVKSHCEYEYGLSYLYTLLKGILSSKHLS